MQGKKQRVAWLYRGHLNFRNACRYQRLMAAARRHRVTLFTKRSCAVPQEVIESLEAVNRSPITGWASLDSLLFMPFTLMRFLWSHRRRPFDIVWTPPDQSLVLGFLVKALLGRRIRWVADMWDEPRDVISSSRLSLRYLFTQVFPLVVRLTLRYADLVIAVGPSLDEGLPKALQEHYRVPRGRVRAVSNGVDLEMFQPQGAPQKQEGFHVLYVGEVGRYYGVDVLLEAAVRLRALLPNLKLVLAGPSINAVEAAWLRRAIAKQDLEGCVACLGPRPSEEIPSLVEGADVCSYPFLPGLRFDHVMPIKLYEYLAMGRCVVASALPGVCTIITHEENGLLVTPGDAQAMAEAIHWIFCDRALRARLEANARPSVRHASWAEINKRVLAAVEGL